MPNQRGTGTSSRNPDPVLASIVNKFWYSKTFCTEETKTMSSASFDFAPLLPAGLPPPAVRWTGRVKFDFTGGNNDADRLPLDGLIAAADAVLRREGRTLSTYGLSSGPQGYRALREFLVGQAEGGCGHRLHAPTTS